MADAINISDPNIAPSIRWATSVQDATQAFVESSPQVAANARSPATSAGFISTLDETLTLSRTFEPFALFTRNPEYAACIGQIFSAPPGRLGLPEQMKMSQDRILRKEVPPTESLRYETERDRIHTLLESIQSFTSQQDAVYKANKYISSK